MAEAVRLSASGVKSVLGLDPTVNVNPHNNIADVSFVNKFSPAEMKAKQAWGIFAHPFRLPRQGRGTGAQIESFLWKRSFHRK